MDRFLPYIESVTLEAAAAVTCGETSQCFRCLFSRPSPFVFNCQW